MAIVYQLSIASLIDFQLGIFTEHDGSLRSSPFWHFKLEGTKKWRHQSCESAKLCSIRNCAVSGMLQRETWKNCAKWFPVCGSYIIQQGHKFEFEVPFLTKRFRHTHMHSIHVKHRLDWTIISFLVELIIPGVFDINGNGSRHEIRDEKHWVGKKCCF